MADLRGDQLNVIGPSLLVRDKTNKLSRGSGSDLEGVQGEEIDELALDLTNNELLVLARQWEDSYKGYSGKITTRQKTNKEYYLGKQSLTAIDTGTIVAGNRLFSATETFLAAALAKEPEPVVYSDNTPQGNEESRLVKTILQSLADSLVIRRKFAMMVRHWNIYFIGVLKTGWDEEIHEIKTEVVNPKNMLLDPNGYVDVYGDFVGWTGERITVTAEKLSELFPEWTQYVSEMVEYKMGTDVTYTEWWTDEYCFYTFKSKILDKSRNPHFNYPKKMKEKKRDVVEQVLKKGNNHFARPKKPYTFLSVYSLQEQPHDETSLIEQNIPNQRLITRRVEQIDKNLSNANNSFGFSLDAGWTQQTAKQAADGRAKGHPVLLAGDSQRSIVDFPAMTFPAEAFKELQMNMEALDNIYGTEGITANQDKETTARGMILNQQRDSTRIGGGVGDALEQVADNVFNQWYQFMKVYYDEPHTAMILGKMQSVELAQINMEDITRKIVITVAADSMSPKDEITQMNQAMSLAEAGFLDPKTLLTIQNVPNPEETAEATVLWSLDKQLYLQKMFPELMQQMQAQQQGGQPQPGAPQPQAQPPPSGVVSPIQPGPQVEPPESLSAVQLPH